MSDESQESLGSKIVGRVAFVYRNEYAEGGWNAYGIDAESGIDVGYKRYDIVLKTGVGLKTPGLYHCIRTISKTECKAWETLCAEGYVAGEYENVTDKTAFVLYLPMTDVYTFLKEHLKADNTIDITFYDEDLKDDDHPNGYSQYNADGTANTDYHNIKFNVNASALTFDSGTVTVNTFSNKSDINKGYDLTGQSVIDVVKELLCPYVLPTIKISLDTNTFWAGLGGTATWTATYTPGSMKNADGWWDDATSAKFTMTTSTATKQRVFLPTDPVNTTEKHKFSVKDVGTNPKYVVQTTSEPSAKIYQPSFYWYSTDNLTTVSEIDVKYVKKLNNGVGTIEDGRTVTDSESGLLFWYYLIPAGAKVIGFFDAGATKPNSYQSVIKNISVTIKDGTKTCTTVKCDLYKAGAALTKTAKFTNLMK